MAHVKGADQGSVKRPYIACSPSLRIFHGLTMDPAGNLNPAEAALKDSLRKAGDVALATRHITGSHHLKNLARGSDESVLCSNYCDARSLGLFPDHKKRTGAGVEFKMVVRQVGLLVRPIQRRSRDDDRRMG